MRLSTTALFLLPALISATTLTSESSTQPTATPSENQALTPDLWTAVTTYLPPSVTSVPAPESTSSHFYDPIVSLASDALEEIEEHLHIDLRKRQGAPVTGAPVAVTVGVQVSPTTLYYVNSVVNGVAVQASVLYVQKFSAVPDQWPSPTAQGTIGLGTITGQVGVVKTKRSVPEATAAVQVVRIKGREVAMG